MNCPGRAAWKAHCGVLCHNFTWPADQQRDLQADMLQVLHFITNTQQHITAAILQVFFRVMRKVMDTNSRNSYDLLSPESWPFMRISNIS